MAYFHLIVFSQLSVSPEVMAGNVVLRGKITVHKAGDTLRMLKRYQHNLGSGDVGLGSWSGGSKSPAKRQQAGGSFSDLGFFFCYYLSNCSKMLIWFDEPCREPSHRVISSKVMKFSLIIVVILSWDESFIKFCRTVGYVDRFWRGKISYNGQFFRNECSGVRFQHKSWMRKKKNDF